MDVNYKNAFSVMLHKSCSAVLFWYISVYIISNNIYCILIFTVYIISNNIYLLTAFIWCSSYGIFRFSLQVLLDNMPADRLSAGML